MLRYPILVFTLFVAGLACGLLSSPAYADGGASFAVQPVHYDPALPASASYSIFDLQQGATVQSEVRITNSGGAAGTVRLYAVDATTGQTSGTVFHAQADAREDVGGWLALSAAELTLQPGENHIVPFTVTVPAGVRPGQHVGGIVAENAALAGNGQGVDSGALQIKVQSLTIMAVQVNLPGTPVEQLDATDVTAGGGNGYQTLLLGLRNSGTMMLKPQGRLKISNAQRQLVQQQTLQLDTLLPQTAIAYPVYVTDSALPAGDYTADLTLAYGNGGQLHTTLPFQITAAQAVQVFQGQKPLRQTAAAAKPAASPAASGGTRSQVLPLLGLVGLGGLIVAAFIIRQQRHGV